MEYCIIAYEGDVLTAIFVSRGYLFYDSITSSAVIHCTAARPACGSCSIAQITTRKYVRYYFEAVKKEKKLLIILT